MMWFNKYHTCGHVKDGDYRQKPRDRESTLHLEDKKNYNLRIVMTYKSENIVFTV